MAVSFESLSFDPYKSGEEILGEKSENREKHNSFLIS